MINKTSEKNRLLSDKEDTKKECFVKTDYNKVMDQKDESTEWRYKPFVSHVLKIVIILLILILVYLFYKKKMVYL